MLSDFDLWSLNEHVSNNLASPGKADELSLYGVTVGLGVQRSVFFPPGLAIFFLKWDLVLNVWPGWFHRG